MRLMMILRLAALVILLSLTGRAQNTQTLINQTLTLPRITAYTVATLPTPTSGNPIAVVTDADTPGSCETGGGTDIALCRWNGTAWVSLGGAAGGGGGSMAIQLDGSAIGTEATLDILTGNGIVPAVIDAGSKITVQFDIDTSDIPAGVPTKAKLQSATNPMICTSASASGTTYTATCATTLGALATKQTLFWFADVTNSSTTPTLSIDTLTAKTLVKHDGTALAANDIKATALYRIWYDGTSIRVVEAGLGGGSSGSSDHYTTWYAASGKQGIASTSFDLPSTNYPSALCDAEASGKPTPCYLRFSENATSGTAQYFDGDFPIVSTNDTVATVRWRTAATSGNLPWWIQGVCIADGEVSNPSYGSAVSFTADAAKGTTLQENDTAALTLTTSDVLTGCAVGERLKFRIKRDATEATDTLGAASDLIWLQFKQTR